MHALTTPLALAGMSILSGVLILAGGIALFVVGRGRGALSGAGFVVLALGTAVGSLISMFGPAIIHSLDMPHPSFSVIYVLVQLLFDVVGWGLVIAAVLSMARTAPVPPYGQAPYGQAPYGQAPPGYGTPPPSSISGGGPPSPPAG